MTFLFYIVLSLTNPSLSPMIGHRVIPGDFAACEIIRTKAAEVTPLGPDLKLISFCATPQDLTVDTK